jgi:glutamate dehydrogenase
VSTLNLLEAARAEGRVRVSLSMQDGDLVLHVYQPVNLTLSELLPVIDNFGVVVSDEWSSDDAGAHGVDHFRVAGVTGVSPEDVLARKDKLVNGLEAVFARKMASDPTNRLVLRANLSWQEVDLVRAYVGYAKQIKLAHPIPRVQEILANRASAVAALVKLFQAKFDPALDAGRAAAIGAAVAGVEDELRQIPTVDEDFVLRFLYNLVEATVRTNFFRPDRVFHYISFKVEHARIRHLPLPRMMVEIYVHHFEMEGVHLRGGPIARGGLRYSDRADFRTEVLGLVTTQMVKNVVIVPEGSKGGFYVKYTIDDPAERRKVGDRLYQVLIRGMLDVTDNLVDGRVVRPPNVVAQDGNDPYLVVAADKGTAHLSDTANRLSLEYGFWLGDAFASGGSEGYDHKVLGITARGGWVLVKRLFREMGMDADKQEFTCFGIGDCGGDVFGNGVIETPKMKLLAAFNHVHIFLDPNPDAARSFVERKRLFDEVGGWEKYDTSLISKGGGVYSRKQKLIPLSEEVRAMLGTDEPELGPNQVINLILKMQVDLFWNGGIGTYVIASNQTNADANDPPNDELRVTATDLRCKVVGEGGNLGFTQQARIEFAQNHGRINTDFVDNSGGVDTSDHEVNLKILLNPMVASGRITMARRNEIIRSMAEEVANTVLENNNQNGRLISLDEVRSARDPFAYGRAIDWICQKGSVSRHFLSLPSDEELRRRAAANRGLVRPELAVLQAHVKMHVFKLLMQEDPASIPAFDRLLKSYFPTRMQREFGEDLPNHMLAKAIVMTTLLTEVATDAGASYFPMMLELTGASAGRVASSWTEGVRLLGGSEIRNALIAAHAHPSSAYAAWTRFTDAILQLVLTWLTPGSAGYAGEDEARFNQALDAIASTRSGSDATYAKNSHDKLVASAIPEGAAHAVLRAGSAARASEICFLSAQRGESIRDTALLYQALGVASGLTHTLRDIAARRGSGRWDPVALGIQRTRYRMLLRELALKSKVGGAALRFGVERGVELVSDERVKGVADVVLHVVGKEPDVAALLVGEQRIRAVLQGG